MRPKCNFLALVQNSILLDGNWSLLITLRPEAGQDWGQDGRIYGAKYRKILEENLFHSMRLEAWAVAILQVENLLVYICQTLGGNITAFKVR